MKTKTLAMIAALAVPIYAIAQTTPTAPTPPGDTTTMGNTTDPASPPTDGTATDSTTNTTDSMSNSTTTTEPGKRKTRRPESTPLG
jgi:hypothetical protein